MEKRIAKQRAAELGGLIKHLLLRSAVAANSTYTLHWIWERRNGERERERIDEE